MTDRYVQVPIKKEVQTRLKAMKGPESYSTYIARILLSGSKDDE